MKRLILSLLLALLVAPIVIGQQPSDIIIGVVTYQFEGRVWEVGNYANPINTDLQVLPVDYTTDTRTVPTVEPVHYLVDIRQAATAAEQVAAIESLMLAKVAALVITPVTEGVESVKAAIQAAAAKVPVVLHGYKVAGLNLPFAGMDIADLGKNLANSNTRPRSFVVIGNLSEYNQKGFIELLQGNAGFKGFYEAGTDGQAEAAMAIRDVADLWGIVVSNAKYASGAAEAIKAATAGTDRLIKLGSVGAPDNWKDLFDQKLLSAAFTFDSYQALQQAAVMAKIMIRDGVTPENFYPDVLFYTRTGAYNHTSYPYSMNTPNRLASFWN